MSSLNITDLYDSINNKNLKRFKKFDDILLKIHQWIKYHAELEQTYCIYNIPEFIFGTPPYNINDLKKYLIKTLETNGFKVLYFHPNTILISWGQAKKLQNNNDKKSKSKTNNQFKLINDYNPKGDFVYNETALLNIRDKTKNLIN